MFGKAPLTSREVMMRSTGSLFVTVCWRKMAWCGDQPGIAPQRLAGMPERTVRTILNSMTAHTMGRQLSGLAQFPFLQRGRKTLAQSVARRACPVTTFHRRSARGRRRYAGRW